MNRDQVEGKWKVFTGTVQERWEKFTEALGGISGKPKQLASPIAHRTTNEAHEECSDGTTESMNSAQ